MSKEDFHVLITQLPVSREDKKRLAKLSPLTYTGLAEQLALKNICTKA